MMLLVAKTWAPWLTDDVPDLSFENMAPAEDGADGRLLPLRKSDQTILSDIGLGAANLMENVDVRQSTPTVHCRTTNAITL